MVDNVESLQRAVNAAKRILINIAGSDFTGQCGTYAAYHLRDYRVDLARDIYIEFNGGDEPTEDQVTWMSFHADWVFDGVVVKGVFDE
jgi:hypothetical protein